MNKKLSKGKKVKEKKKLQIKRFQFNQFENKSVLEHAFLNKHKSQH